MIITKTINDTRFNSFTKEIEIVAKFALTGSVSSDEFTVSKIEMNGEEITGDEFFSEISKTAVGLDGFMMVMQQRWEFAEINIATSRVVEAHIPVAFPE